MTLLVRIKVHSQQICGLAWSPSGEDFATGGNDNLCCLFNYDTVIDMESSPTTALGVPGYSAFNSPCSEEGPILSYAVNPGDFA